MVYFLQNSYSNQKNAEENTMSDEQQISFIFSPEGFYPDTSGCMLPANLVQKWTDRGGFPALYAYGPVSYTHLDVYKRQLYGLAVRTLRALGKNQGFST